MNLKIYITTIFQSCIKTRHSRLIQFKEQHTKAEEESWGFRQEQ